MIMLWKEYSIIFDMYNFVKYYTTENSCNGIFVLQSWSHGLTDFDNIWH